MRMRIVLLVVFTLLTFSIFAAEKSEYIATIGTTGLTKEDLDNRLAKIPPMYQSYYKTTEQQNKLLENMCIEEAFYKKALEMELDKNKKTQLDIVNAVIPTYTQEYYKQEITNKLIVPDKDIQKYYNDNLEKFFVESSIDIKYLRAGSDSLATLLLSEYKSGVDFDSLIVKYSTHNPTKKKQGVIKNIKSNGNIPTIGKDAVLDSLIQHAEVAVLKGPITTSTGIHFFLVTTQYPSYTKPINEVKEEIVNFLKPDLEKQMKENIHENLKSKYKLFFDNKVIQTVNIQNDSSYNSILSNNFIKSDTKWLNMTVAEYVDFLKAISPSQLNQLSDPQKAEEYWKTYMINHLIYEDIQKKDYINKVKELPDVIFTEKATLIRTAYKNLILDKIVLTEEDKKNYYNENKEKYALKAYRNIQAFTFDSEKKAKKAYKKIEKALRSSDSEKINLIRDEYCLTIENDGVINNVYNNGIIPGTGKDEIYSTAVWNAVPGHLSEIIKNSKEEFVFVRILEDIPASYTSYSEVEVSLNDIVKQDIAKKLFEKTKQELTEYYQIKIYPEKMKTTLSAQELFDLAEESQMKKRFTNALDYYEQIIDIYKNGTDDYKAMFMKGFILSEDLNEKEKALAVFEDLVQKYPSGELHESAQYMIEAIKNGETEDIIETND